MSESFLHEQFALDGKTAIVTGASRGLGRAAAIALSNAGANVVLVARDEDGLKETASLMSTKVLIAPGDVTDASDMMTTLQKAISQFGTIDILINNAGIIRRAAAIDITGKDWNDVVNTNLNAVFGWAQAVGKLMIEQGSGKIVNLASLLSFSGGLNVAAYAAAKGGVAQLTKALANEWAKYGVCVNAIAPGYIRTEATAALRSNSERSAQILARIPAGRYGEPDDLAGTIVYLASKASDYMNGHVLVIDGGFMAY